MKNESKLVSVIIPAKDRPLELRRCLESVVSQTHKKIEVVVVENNSKDPGSLYSLVASFNDERLKIKTKAPCLNANVARNYGRDLSGGDYIAFLDSDDEWEEGHLENSVKLLESNSADFVYAAAQVDDGEALFEKKSRQIKDQESPFDFLVGFNQGSAQTSSYVMTSKTAMSLDWDETLSRHQDYDYFIRLCAVTKPVFNSLNKTVIHWEKGEKRSFDPTSQKMFYKKYSNTLCFSSDAKYLYMMLKKGLENRSFSYTFFIIMQILALIPRHAIRKSS